jgi:hypothetical protein
MQPRGNKSRLQTLAVRLLGVAFALNYCMSASGSEAINLPAGSPEEKVQAALDALPAGAEVHLGAGFFPISRPLFVRHSHQMLRGAGPATILRLTDGANCPVVVVGPPIDDAKNAITQAGVADLLIDGNRRGQKVEHWRTVGDGLEINNNGVHVWNTTDATIEHVVCCRCRSGGMVVADTQGLRVTDFRSFDNQFDGLACYQTKGSHFSNLRLHDNLAAGISVDLDFSGNTFTNAVLAANDVGVFIRDSRDNLFQGLTIARSVHDGVFMAQSVVPTAKGWRLVPKTECTGNHFDGLEVRDCGGMAFRVNDASCTNNTISGAIFQRNAKGGLGQPPSHPVTLREVANR